MIAFSRLSLTLTGGGALRPSIKRAQFSRKSRGVLRFGPCDGAMTLPSGPIAGSRSGRDTLVSAGVAPGGRSSPPLRPHPARPSAVTSTARAAIRAKRRADILGSPSAGISGADGDNMAKLARQPLDRLMQKLPAGKFHFEPPSNFTSFDHLVGAGEDAPLCAESRRRHAD